MYISSNSGICEDWCKNLTTVGVWAALLGSVIAFIIVALVIRCIIQQVKNRRAAAHYKEEHDDHNDHQRY